jgi:hypothetical protein
MKKKLFIIILCIIMNGDRSTAQILPPPPPATPLPVDGGTALLIAGCAAYAVKRGRKKKSEF